MTPTSYSLTTGLCRPLLPTFPDLCTITTILTIILWLIIGCDRVITHICLCIIHSWWFKFFPRICWGNITHILGHVTDILGHVTHILGHVTHILGHVTHILGHVTHTCWRRVTHILGHVTHTCWERVTHILGRVTHTCWERVTHTSWEQVT